MYTLTSPLGVDTGGKEHDGLHPEMFSWCMLTPATQLCWTLPLCFTLTDPEKGSHGKQRC